MRIIQRKQLPNNISRRAKASGQSLRIVVATEEPIEHFDIRRGLYNEVLMMAGLQLRQGVASCPLVDSFNRSSTSFVYGSIRNLRVERGQLVGNIAFARDKKSQAIKHKFLDGHLSDFSLSVMPFDILRIERGEAYRHIQGPADIVSRWTPRDVSIVVAK